MTGTGRRVGAVLACLLMVVGAVAPVVGTAGAPSTAAADEADLGAGSETVQRVDAASSNTSTGSVSADADAEDDPARLSSGVRLRLAQSNAGERIPVLVLFETRPNEAVSFGTLGDETARRKLQRIAAREQRAVRDYLSRARERNRASRARSFWSTNALAVRATPATVREIAAYDSVEAVVLDRTVTRATAGIQPLSGIAERYGNTTAPSGFETVTSGDRAWGVTYIGADDVQERGVTGSGVNVSVIDTGIDDSHPALNGSVIKWKDFTSDNYTEPADAGYHGTHVAATIAGRPNGSRAVGVAPGANLFGAKVFSEDGGGARLSDIIAAWEWSANNSADVISASLGAPPIIDESDTNVSMGADATGSVEKRVYANGTGVFQDFEAPAYKPSSVFVVVEPLAVNGTQLANDTAKAAVMRNLTVTLTDPSGDASLQGVPATWAFQSGEVPEAITARKYKPDPGQPITETGNWTVTVTSETGKNVTYRTIIAPVYPTNGSDALSDAVDTITKSHDVVSVVAAGNSGYILGNRSVGSPAAAESAISVGATGYRVNDVAEFSSRGPVGYGAEQRPGVDLIAPGTDVVSAVPANTIGGPGPDSYAALSGTSMATPHVSGTIALLFDAEPSLNASEAENAIESTAQEIPAGENAAGAGVLDAYAAVNATNASALSGTESPESGRHTLFAGLSATAEDRVYVNLDPHRDAQGDASSAPDIQATSRFVANNFELATYDDAYWNATFRLYVDVDQNDSTGDTDQAGSEYLLVVNRTFDGVAYEASVTGFAYNASTDAYDRTEAVNGYPGTATGRFVELFSLRLPNGAETSPFDWHVTAAPLGATAGDRFPDQGQATNGAVQVAINATAVAWNATAGAPDVGAEVTFTTYNETGTAVTATATTDSRGQANATLQVTARQDSQEFTVDIADTHGNQVTQEYVVLDAGIEYELLNVDNSLAYTITDRNYVADRNGTVTLNIPVYNETETTITPYTGNASLSLYNFDTDTQYVVNNISVDDGVVRTTINLSQTSIDDGGEYISVELSLNRTFDHANPTAFAASVRISGSGTHVALAPRTQIVAPGSNATLSFQQAREGSDEPANETVAYEVTWITDRNVASLFSDLPSSTVDALKQRRRAGSSASPLAPKDRRELEEAIQNISESGVSVKTTDGLAEPTARGVGTFEVSPPADTRFGVVSAGDAGSESADSYTLVFVGQGTEPYLDEPTEPVESGYDLDVDAYWPSETRDGVTTPSENITVRVELFNDDDERVGGANVTLYTLNGEQVTVTTNATREVVVEVPAPDKDWLNTTFYEREQQILGVAEGYRTADGEPASATETVYGEVFDFSDEEVVPFVDTRYVGDGVLNTTLSYRNATTYEPTAGQPTLFIAREGDFGTEEDIAVKFVRPGSNESVTFEDVDPTPPAIDESAEYEVLAQTASMNDDHYYVDFADAEGLSATVSTPDSLTDETTSTVTVTVTDRNGDPVANAVVRWSYVLYTDTQRSYESVLPSAREGDTRIGTTDANGTVTFRVTPELAESIASGTLGYQVGVVTENTSKLVVAEDFVFVDQTSTTLSGTFEYGNGTAAANDTVAVFGTGQGGVVRTDSTGSWGLSVEPDSAYDVQYYQAALGGDFDGFPRDGVVDIYAADNVSVGSQSVDLGTQTVPNGSVLDVKVVDEDGDPVHNASVHVTHIANDATAGFIGNTSADGLLRFGADAPSGIEVTGDVRVEVEPPSGDDRFRNETYVRNVTVTSDETVTVTLEEYPTVSGRIFYPDGSTNADDAVVTFSGGLEIDATDSQGRFELTTFNESDVDVTFYQGEYWVTQNDSKPIAPRDGVPDLFTIARVNTTAGDVDLGNVTLPEGHVVNVTVVDEDGNPVPNATIGVSHVSPDGGDAGIGRIPVDTDGQLHWGDLEDSNFTTPPGIELTGNVSITVQPPANATRFKDRTYTRNLTVTGERNLTVVLNETEPKPTVGVENATVSEGNTTTVNVTLSDVPDGLASFELAVFTSDNTTANITGATISPAFNRSQSHATVFASGIELYGVDSANNVTAGDSPVVLAQVEVTGVDAGEATLTVEPVVFENDSAGEFTPAVRNGTVTVTAVEGAGPTVRVGSATVPPNATTTVPITLSSAPDGLSGFNITVTVDNATAATLTNASANASYDLKNVSVGPNGTTVTIKAADTSNVTVPGEENVTIATVEVTGQVNGTATLDLTVNQMDDDTGARIDPTVEPGTVQVRDLPAVVGDDRPTDPDGDGKYEDVNGNGRVDFDDLVVLFENLDDPAVTDNADAYDFNGNGKVDFDDIVTLFEVL